jgi:hypothetical protein
MTIILLFYVIWNYFKTCLYLFYLTFFVLYFTTNYNFFLLEILVIVY